MRWHSDWVAPNAFSKSIGHEVNRVLGDPSSIESFLNTLIAPNDAIPIPSSGAAAGSGTGLPTGAAKLVTVNPFPIEPTTVAAPVPRLMV